MTAEVQPVVYWVNQYINPPEAPGNTRHYAISRHLKRLGRPVVLVTSDFVGATRRYSRRSSKWSLGPRDEVTPTGSRVAWCYASPYRVNDWQRAASMISFAISAFLYLCKVPRHQALFVGSTPHLFAAASAYLASLLRGVPFVLEVRDLWPESYEAVGDEASGIVVSVLGAIARWLYRAADRIIILAPSASDYLRTTYGVPGNRIVYIPNGIDVEAHESQDADPETTHVVSKFSSKTVDFVYTGAHGPANGLNLLIEALSLIETKDPAWPTGARVHLIGDGTAKAELRKHAEELHLRSIEFHDPVPRAAIPVILRHADVGLMLLKEADLFEIGVSPNKLFDYLWSSLPVLTNVGGDTLAAVVDSGAGFGVRPGDPMELAEGLQRMRNRVQDGVALGERPRDYVRRHHSFTAAAKTFQSMAEELSEANRASRSRVHRTFRRRRP